MSETNAVPNTIKPARKFNKRTIVTAILVGVVTTALSAASDGLIDKFADGMKSRLNPESKTTETE